MALGPYRHGAVVAKSLRPLREEARRCRRLARAQADETVRDLLNYVACQFDCVASDIEDSARDRK
jgi:hypothetical protein